MIGQYSNFLFQAIGQVNSNYEDKPMNYVIWIRH